MLHRAGSQVAALSCESVLQVVAPDTTKPLPQVGWHDEPGARRLVHDPTPPLAGPAEPSHAAAAVTVELSVALVTWTPTFPADRTLVRSAIYP